MQSIDVGNPPLTFEIGKTKKRRENEEIEVVK
jgi:hypothetical protein